MKENIEEFEEIDVGNEEKQSPESNAEAGKGAKPDFRIVQPGTDQNGNAIYTNIGGMWKNVSKNGNEFYMLRIGKLRLLVFPNDKGGVNE
ncbi:hypothetical protein KAW38_00490 [Candidatus Micrarchaeota archaeon]|nr:hypothetical protein [Candidatus Micrarchaeota archaeon]